MARKDRGAEPTLEEHVQIGRDIKAAIKAVHKVLKWSHYFYAKHVDGLRRCDTWLGRVQCHMDGRLFHEYPYLTNDAFVVYYHEDEDADAAELMALAEAGGMVNRNWFGGMPRP